MLYFAISAIRLEKFIFSTGYQSVAWLVTSAKLFKLEMPIYNWQSHLIKIILYGLVIVIWSSLIVCVMCIAFPFQHFRAYTWSWGWQTNSFDWWSIEPLGFPVEISWQFSGGGSSTSSGVSSASKHLSSSVSTLSAVGQGIEIRQHISKSSSDESLRYISFFLFFSLSIYLKGFDRIEHIGEAVKSILAFIV